jgi:hypothetical protein
VLQQFFYVPGAVIVKIPSDPEGKVAFFISKSKFSSHSREVESKNWEPLLKSSSRLEIGNKFFRFRFTILYTGTGK